MTRRMRLARRFAAGAATAVIVAACSRPGASPPQSVEPGMATSEPNPTPVDTLVPSLAASSQPGRPYDGATLLSAMRDSRRPGGVPDELETEAIAQAVADELWTFDGEPWVALAIGGSCGGGTCSLDVAGTADGGGSDLYAFRVDPGAQQVEVTETDLHGYPSELEDVLDAMVRDAVDATRLSGLALLGAAWMTPPDSGHFRLAYRSGGEEGAPGLDILIDADAGAVLEIRDSP